MRKKLLSILLTACMMISLIPTAAFAEETDRADTPPIQDVVQESECSCTLPCTEEAIDADCTVCAAEGADLTPCKGEAPAHLSATPSAAITGNGYIYDAGTLTIDSNAGTTAWRDNTNIIKANVTTVVIGPSVTSIGDSAFESCTGLTSVNIPSGVTSIGSYAFQSCESLESVTFAGDSQLAPIGDGTFTSYANQKEAFTPALSADLTEVIAISSPPTATFEASTSKVTSTTASGDIKVRVKGETEWSEAISKGASVTLSENQMTMVGAFVPNDRDGPTDAIEICDAADETSMTTLQVGRQPGPSAIEIDYLTAESKRDIPSAVQYRVVGATAWEKGSGGSTLKIATNDYFGKTIEYRNNPNGAALASNIKTLVIPAQPVLTVVSTADEDAEKAGGTRITPTLKVGATTLPSSAYLTEIQYLVNTSNAAQTATQISASGNTVPVSGIVPEARRAGRSPNSYAQEYIHFYVPATATRFASTLVTGSSGSMAVAALGNPYGTITVGTVGKDATQVVLTLVGATWVSASKENIDIKDSGGSSVKAAGGSAVAISGQTATVTLAAGAAEGTYTVDVPNTALSVQQKPNNGTAITFEVISKGYLLTLNASGATGTLTLDKNKYAGGIVAETFTVNGLKDYEKLGTVTGIIDNGGTMPTIVVTGDNTFTLLGVAADKVDNVTLNVTVVPKQKALELANITLTTSSKTYDGTTTAAGPTSLSISSDIKYTEKTNVTASATSYEYKTSDAGEIILIAKGITLAGPDKAYYTLGSSLPSAGAEYTVAPIAKATMTGATGAGTFNGSSPDLQQALAGLNQAQIVPTITVAGDSQTLAGMDTVANCIKAGSSGNLTTALNAALVSAGFKNADGTADITKMNDGDSIDVALSFSDFDAAKAPNFTGWPSTGNITIALTYQRTGGGGSGGGGGSSSSGGSSTPSTPGASAMVDGKTADLGKTETKGDTTTAILDQAKLGKRLETAKAGSTVIIPVNTAKDNAAVQLTAESVAKMAEKDMTLAVKSGKISYELPANAVDTAAVLQQLGATDASEVSFTVTITSEKNVTVTGLVVPAVSFNVSASYNGKTVTVDRFDTMVPRIVELTKEQAGKVTTAVVVESSGVLRHIPTDVYTEGGKWYAKMNSMTNSTYALIAQKSTFADVSGKWYEATANELSARAVTTGVFGAAFQGETAITRAEFAALLVNALGLPKDAKADFSDVVGDAWYSEFVATANKYGIANGIGGGKFVPDATITRQEAMVMIHRAATIVGYTGGSTDNGTYTDRAEVGAWAADGVAFNLGNGLIVGNDGNINPTATITRAQTATVLLRLLQKAELVDVRTQA